jgi:hypothetical protein
MPLLVVLICRLTIIFVSFGLFATRSATVLVSLSVSALSVSGAILLILEMYSPYRGLIHVTSAPLRASASWQVGCVWCATLHMTTTHNGSPCG